MVVEFTWVSGLFMVLILGLIWGGFVVVLLLIAMREAEKDEAKRRKPSVDKNPAMGKS